jgi:putative membrane protein
MMDMFNYGHGWGMGFGVGFFPLLFWILVIVGIIFLVRGFAPKSDRDYYPTPPASKPDETPRTILEKRYAKGEIDDETFRRMKKELEE